MNLTCMWFYKMDVTSYRLVRRNMMWLRLMPISSRMCLSNSPQRNSSRRCATISLKNFMINTGSLPNPLLQSVARESIIYGNIREEHSRTVYFTDDRAPVEQLIDQIILGAVENKGN